MLIGACGKPLKSGSSLGDGAVVIAVIFVWMMQIHQIVGVITVRDRLVTASGALGMLRVVVTAGVSGRTRGRIRAALGEHIHIKAEIEPGLP